MVAICGSVIERKYTENAIHVPDAVNVESKLRAMVK